MSSASVTAESQPAHGGATGGAAPGWQQATVAEVIDEASDAVTLRLALEEPEGFVPGQYYNVRLPIAGVRARSSGPTRWGRRRRRTRR